MNADEIRSKYMNFAPTRKPLEFELGGDKFRMKVPNVREWSEFFNEVYQQRTGGNKSGGRIYIDLAHKKYACLQLLIDDDGDQIFDAATAKVVFDAPVGSDLDRLASKAADTMEEHVSAEDVGNSDSGSETTKDSSKPSS